MAQSDAIFTSDNAGVSWSRMYLPFARSYALAISQSRLSALYAFDRDNATGNARVFSSRDRGLHWSLTSFQSEDFPNSVTVDPTNVSTVYALTERGLYKSTDSGASWENLKLRENTTRRVFQILFPPRETSTAYVVDADYSYYPEYTVDKSTDGGRTWRTIVTGPTRLAIDPFNPSHLYGIGCPGSYRSTDAGATWTQAAPIASTACVSSLVADPVRRGYLYAGLYVGGVRRSRDAGNTWEQLGVGILGNVFSLAIDPAGLFLHASTSAGVFDLQLGDLPVSPCAPDAERLCLLGGRFEVSAKYGGVAALAVPQGDRFGSFSRSGTAAEEPEIFVKMPTTGRFRTRHSGSFTPA